MWILLVSSRSHAMGIVLMTTGRVRVIWIVSSSMWILASCMRILMSTSRMRIMRVVSPSSRTMTSGHANLLRCTREQESADVNEAFNVGVVNALSWQYGQYLVIVSIRVI
jgi:hypothetical protein